MQISTVTAGQQVQAIAFTERAIFRAGNSVSGEFPALGPCQFSEWKIGEVKNSARDSSFNLESGKFADLRSIKFTTLKIDSADNGEIEE